MYSQKLTKSSFTEHAQEESQISPHQPFLSHQHQHHQEMMVKYLLLTLLTAVLCDTAAFLQASPNGLTPTNTNTAQFMGRKVKPSMADRRKKRAKRTVSPDLETVRSIEKEVVSERKIEPPSPALAEEVANHSTETRSKDAEEIGQKAASLLASQRRSVDVLTFIRKRVEEHFPVDDAAESLMNNGYFIYDGFLTSQSSNNELADIDAAFGDELLSEMFEEGIDMLSSDKLERDITRLGEGEFVSLITGGDKYVDCPRLTEYVVCMTRHLPSLLNKLDAVLSNTASMGSIRMYDRKTKLGTAALLVSNTPDEDKVNRPFGVVCENNDDGRRVTAQLFLSSKSWDSSCGGGITIEDGESVAAIRDRLVLLRSDTCSHRLDSWTGSDEDDMIHAGCVTIHFVKS